ncbi:MAG: restriction endonuclease subunit S [Steroidobacteraceae bacterium]
MAGEYDAVPLGEVALVRSGFAFKSSDWTETGIPVVKIANVKDGRLVMDTCSFVPQPVADSAAEFALRAGDILIAMTGYIGDVAKVRERDLPAAINQRVGRFTVRDPRRLDQGFLFYLLRDAEVRKEIEGLGYGSAQPNVSPSLIHSVEVPLPPLPDQRAIAHILGTLDDKIDLNRRMNETLEAMARALFKSWFVDFDPVRAKTEGRDPGLPQLLAELFPDSFEDSELGEIPKRWGVERLSDVMTFEGGSQPPASEFVSEPREGHVRLVQIRDFYSSNHVTFVPDTAKLRKFATDDIMIARYGSSGNAEKPSDSLARICRGLSGAYNVALVKVIPHRPIREFIGHFLQSPAFQVVIKGMGARSVQSGFRKEDLDVISIVTASDSVHVAFERFAGDVWRQTHATNNLSRSIARLRDSLLPKLISGEVRVNDTKVLERVTT